MNWQANEPWAVTLNKAKGLTSDKRFFVSLRMTVFDDLQHGSAGLAVGWLAG
jgi:hypothetical protein